MLSVFLSSKYLAVDLGLESPKGLISLNEVPHMVFAMASALH